MNEQKILSDNELKTSALMLADRLDFLAIGLEKIGCVKEAKKNREKAKALREFNK